MIHDLVPLLYLVAGVLFILALRGLSSPVTSRRGNYLGMTGMAIAVLTTLAVARPESPLTWAMILGGIAVGGSIGAVTARRIPMTAMPELVAAFHSLVGLAACLVATAAIYAPAAYGIAEGTGIKLESLIELSLGVAIGAITFTGSLIAFAKLNGNMSGAPIILPARHLLNIALGLAGFPGKLQAIADHVRQLLDLGILVMMSEQDRTPIALEIEDFFGESGAGGHHKKERLTATSVTSS